MRFRLPTNWLRSLAIGGAVLVAAACPPSDQTGVDDGDSTSHDTALIVDAGPDLSTWVGDTLTLSFRFSKPGAAGPWSYTVAWGDGATAAGSGTPDASQVVSHVFAADGVFSTKVTVRQHNGGSNADSVRTVVASRGAVHTMLASGDIGECTLPYAAATATMIDAIPGTVAALGDLAYPDGSAADFAGCYESTWGRHKARTRPALGNHEYNTPGAAGYFAYFGATAGDPAKGYYSYELGAWHVIVLNSNLAYIDEAAQEEWLRADLAAHPRTCTMAYFHHPRFSSGATHGNTPRLQTIWQTLYDANADLVLTGHDHIYERFAPQAGDGSLDNVRGIRQFVVGSGGGGSYSIGPAIANSETRTREHGILKLEMDAVSYRWEFLGIPGTTFKDSGSGRCH